MESDVIQSSGDCTVLDLWVQGRVRHISIPRDAIEAFLDFSAGETAVDSDEDRRDFVRKNLRLVAAAAVDAVRENPAAASITLDGWLLRRHHREHSP